MHASLKHHFIVALPSLAGDENFASTLAYLCQHDADGAFGLIVNKPLELSLHALLDHLHIDSGSVPAARVLRGGPCKPESGFILHDATGDTERSVELGNGLMFSTARELLASIGSGRGPDHWLVALGFAGWGPGQLEAEIAENAWLACPASLDVLFTVPFEERPARAAASVGIDLNLLSPRPGYA
jgi:putative transcriptional regulator